MSEIIFDEKVVDYLNELVDILYTEEYFGHKESAYDYVGWIFDKIEEDLATTPSKLAPSHFEKYGKDLNYCVFKRNSNTQWYVFFNYDFEDDIFLIRYIGNNHNYAKYFE